MSGTSRPHDSGRTDALGRRIRISDQDAQSRADAPPPDGGAPASGSCHECGAPVEIGDDGVSHHLLDDDYGYDYDADADHVPYIDVADLARPEPAAASFKPLTYPMPNRLPATAGVNTVGQLIQDEDLFAEARKAMIHPGESLAYTVDADGCSTGGMLWLSNTPGGDLDLAGQIAAEGADGMTMRIISNTDDGYVFTDWPYEPEGIEITQTNGGSWVASHNGVNSSTYSSREHALAAWHREHRRHQRQARIDANVNQWRELAKTVADTDPELAGQIGEISVGYIGNISGRGDDSNLEWHIWAREWCDPSSIYPSNSISQPLGRTGDIARLNPVHAPAEFDAFLAKMRDGFAAGKFQPRRI